MSVAFLSYRRAMANSILNRLQGRSPTEIWRLAILNIRHRIFQLSPAARSAIASDRAFDRRWGTDTSEGQSTRDLGYTGDLLEHSKRYDPSSEEMLRTPVKALGLDPGEHDFIDYGAGKGRVLMMAMEMGFRSVTGIELSQRLCDVAEANLARFSAQNPGLKPARIIAANAATHQPAGTSIVAYFYNPFDASVMEQVRTCLEQAVDTGNARVTVIYVNPEHETVFSDAPRWIRGPKLRGIATFSLPH
ncbi:hypothetical protein [Sphingomonas sp. S2-65]|uniref:hypothetical protein n=1 Tax=Sphingomonas sp. S2-65 TaxID=2903960 RepID=UPI001F15ADFB|nr:hypothetical protein [Sphingomonas sp. S2-65]UYY58210.1 hypothetical protein LZ586_16350 [Sphingomonas sp. S2-65]